MYFSRFQESKLADLFKYFPVVVVSGARQVGKSTLLTHLFDIPRVVFDPLIDVENARADPQLFLNNRPAPIILDEIQYVPQLVPAIKQKLEKDRSPGQYLLTGSQQWEVMKSLAESLAGRAVFVDLEGFSLGEMAQKAASNSWLPLWLEHNDPSLFSTQKLLQVSHVEQLWRGFLPAAQFLPLNLVPDFHTGYLRTYIERDARQMANLDNWELFAQFFKLCAALSAQEINKSQLGRDLGLTPQTAKRWVDILKATFQWFEISPFSGNTTKRISGKSKGYLWDTGLICHAQSVAGPDSVAGHPLWGALFETAVVSELRKQARLMPIQPAFYHWRSYTGAEVDLVLEWNGKIYPIEIKSKSHPGVQDARGLQAFRQAYPHLSIARGLIVAPAEAAYPVTENDWVVPWDGSV